MTENSTEPPGPWGLPSLDDDTLASVVEAVRTDVRSPADVAAMATTCAAMATALKEELRSRRSCALYALTQRLGWTAETMVCAQILHSTGQRISDAELLLLSSLLFSNSPERVAPLLDHLNLGSNRIGDRGVVGLVAAATRAPRELLEVLILSGNEIGDRGAKALAQAIELGAAWPALRMLSIGGNAAMSAAGEAALREACRDKRVTVRGVGVLRGSPLVQRPMQGSWVVQAGVDSEDATRWSASLEEARRSVVGGTEQEKAFARGVRARAVSRGDPWISGFSAPV